MEKYKKTRKNMIGEVCVRMSMLKLTMGQYLTGAANLLQFPQDTIALLSSVRVLANVAQIFSGYIFEKREKRKSIMIKLTILFTLAFSLMYMIPSLLIFNTSIYSKMAVFTLLYVIGNVVHSLGTPPLLSWLGGITPNAVRGKFFALRNGFNSLTVLVFTYLAGILLDRYSEVGKEENGFLIIGIIILIFGIIRMVLLYRSKEPNYKTSKNKTCLKDCFSVPFKNKGYRKVLTMNVLWNVALQIGGPFTAIYMLSVLDLSYTYIATLGLIANIVKILTVRIWGVISDKYCFSLGLMLAMACLGLSFVFWGFSDGSNAKIILPIVFALSGIGWGGMGTCMINVQYLNAPKENNTMYLGASGTLSGISGFIGTTFIVFIMTLVDEYFIIFNMNVHKYVLVFFVSAIMIGICAAYVFIAFDVRGKVRKKRAFDS